MAVVSPSPILDLSGLKSTLRWLAALAGGVATPLLHSFHSFMTAPPPGDYGNGPMANIKQFFGSVVFRDFRGSVDRKR